MRYDVRRGIRAPLLLLAALTLFAAACQSKTSSSSGSAGGVETADLTVGVLPVVDAAPVYMAQKEGYFQQAQGGAALIPAMVSGDIQVAFSSMQTWYA